MMMDGDAAVKAASSDAVEFRSYPVRWLMLTLYSVASFMNTFLWFTFTPISSATELYFGVGSTLVNVLSIAFMVVYLPACFFAGWLLAKHSLRVSVTVGCLLHLLSTGMRYVAALIASYPLLLCGQIVGAAAQPIFINIPTYLAGVWFGLEDREVATSIGALSNPVGNLAASLIPPFLVTVNSAQHVHGMPLLMLVQLAISSTVFLLVFFLFRSEPEVPPSRTAWLKRMQRNSRSESPAPSEKEEAMRGVLSENADGTNSAGGVAMRPVSDPSKQLLHDTIELVRNSAFVKLCVGLGIGIAVINAILTVIAQAVAPSNYNSTDAGIMGGAMIGSGLISAMIVAPIIDRTHAYKLAVRIGSAGFFGAVVFMFLSLRPDNKPMLIASFATIGMFGTPMLPVCMSLTAEIIFPVNEDSGIALITIFNQALGAVVTLIMGELIKEAPHYHNPFTPLAIFSVCMLGLGMLSIVATRVELKRLNHDRADAAQPNADKRPLLNDGDAAADRPRW
jgi:FLVCR family MFS transporter 7